MPPHTIAPTWAMPSSARMLAKLALLVGGGAETGCVLWDAARALSASAALIPPRSTTPLALTCALASTPVATKVEPRRGSTAGGTRVVVTVDGLTGSGACATQSTSS